MAASSFAAPTGGVGQGTNTFLNNVRNRFVEARGERYLYFATIIGDCELYE
jgi:hypothetical protein